MDSLEQMSRAITHVYSDPRFVAALNWHAEYGITAQIMRQIDPLVTVTLTFHDEPDWDWWEPTTEWRRKAARNRAFAGTTS